MFNKFIFVFLFVSFLTGCGTIPEKSKQTQSGHPEVVIKTTDIDNLKSLLVSDNLKHGYSVVKDTPHSLELHRNFTAEENANMAQLNVLADGLSSILVGGMGYGYQPLPSANNPNYYTDKKNGRTAAITFVKLEKSTRVVVINSMNNEILTATNVFNLWQEYLDNLKNRIEIKIEDF